MDGAPADVAGPLDRRRLALFLLFAFGTAWATAAVIAATGGLTVSPEVLAVGGLSLSLAAVLLPTTYMFAPAAASLLARWLTDEGTEDLMVSVRFFDHWQSYVLSWLAPPVLTALGAGLFFLAFPQYFDPTASAFAERVGRANAAAGGAGDAGMPPLVLALVTVGAAVAINPFVNAIFGFGEELGWRGYLLPKLWPLGARTAVLVHGLVWGVWHWPLILMGYEYGFGYPGEPWTGLALFPVFTVATGTFLAWVTVRSGSVWPASLGHGAINGTVVVALVFARGDPSPLLGPLPIGLVGVVPWLAVAVALLARTGSDWWPPFEAGDDARRSPGQDR